MRILVVGAGRTGGLVLRQLQKNSNLVVLTADSQASPYAVKQGIIPAVDIMEAVTPLNLEYVLQQAQPDLILLTRTTEDLGMGKAPGLDILSGALRAELAAISDVPVIEVARKA
jgi:ketopantoate reductase